MFKFNFVSCYMLAMAFFVGMSVEREQYFLVCVIIAAMVVAPYVLGNKNEQR